jgi:serine/threonine-protein kinase RsbT
LEQELIEILEIKSEADIIEARVRAKAIAEALGFNYMDQTRIATAVSELARNAYQYAGKGKITIKPLNKQGRKGMEMVVEDHGSGIENLDRAMKGGYSTGGGLGMGLSGSKKLMDDFDINTKMGEGTVVTIRKWL